MKKLIINLLFTSFLFSSCSKDDANSKSNNTVDSSFTSTIKINGVLFTPSLDKVDKLTSYTSASTSLTLQSRLLSLTRRDMSTLSSDNLQVTILYPPDQASVSGTYQLKDLSSGVTAGAKGAYTDSNMYIFISGTVTVTDLGNNKFKLVFNNAKAHDSFGSSASDKIVTGYFEGTFTDEKYIE